MIKRKIVTVLLATPVSLLLIFSLFFGEWRQPFELIVMTGMFSLFISPFIILYGVPVTFLSDYLGKQLTGNVRILIAFIVHLFFGVSFGIIFKMGSEISLFVVEVNVASIFATITALIFWAIDELLRKNNRLIFSRCRCNFA
ncbi:hypothetical protein [Radiobacillus sp. PE A8.2]|uniref:hypothetical protein n=1 Tax=Radiobacillus sp. PE A8.2 TaxID=3380349 RepID=UPI00388DD309